MKIIWWEGVEFYVEFNIEISKKYRKMRIMISKKY